MASLISYDLNQKDKKNMKNERNEKLLTQGYCKNIFLN